MALPDQEATMAQVQNLAEDARERLGLPEGHSALKGDDIGRMSTATPIFLGKAHEVVPHSYMMHYKVQHCTNCGADVMLTAFYAKSHIRSRVTGKAVTHLIPCDKPLYNLSVEKALVGRTEVPFCHGCEATVDLSHLPLPPSAAQLYDLDEPRLKGQKSPKAKTEPKPRGATLEDLA